MPRRLNITLDDEPAEKLARLAERMHVVELLDGLPGAYERAQLGLKQAKAGETVSPDEL